MESNKSFKPVKFMIIRRAENQSKCRQTISFVGLTPVFLKCLGQMYDDNDNDNYILPPKDDCCPNPPADPWTPRSISLGSEMGALRVTIFRGTVL